MTSCTVVDGQIFIEDYLHVSAFWSRRYCRLCHLTLTCYRNTGHWNENEFSLSEVEVGVQGHRPVSVNVTYLRSLTPCSLAARLERLRVPPATRYSMQGTRRHTASGILPVGDSAPKMDDWGAPLFPTHVHTSMDIYPTPIIILPWR